MSRSKQWRRLPKLAAPSDDGDHHYDAMVHVAVVSVRLFSQTSLLWLADDHVRFAYALGIFSPEKSRDYARHALEDIRC